MLNKLSLIIIAVSAISLSQLASRDKGLIKDYMMWLNGNCSREGKMRGRGKRKTKVCFHFN